MTSMIKTDENGAIESIIIPEDFNRIRFKFALTKTTLSFKELTYGATNEYTKKDIEDLIKEQYPTNMSHVYMTDDDEEE